MREQRLWPIWLSISEASRALGIQRTVLYSWVRQGMPIYKCGVRRKVLTEDLVRFIRINLQTVELGK
jgi:excisionase family DNA binding protein